MVFINGAADAGAVDLHEYVSYDAVGLRDLIRTGKVRAAEVEAVARQALEIANAQVNGLTLPLFSPALDHAADGPFAGVPFLIKDHGPVAKGVPFSLGSRALPHVVADHDTELMRRFRAAGLVTLGQTTAPELALSFSTESVRYGITRNPWDLERGAGGSSGGAAALVAAGAVPLAHGSDGAGSIRVPASCCGLVGLKPTRSRTAPGPDMGELMFGMAGEFALTRTVRDSAHLLDAIHGPGVGDKYTAPTPWRPYADELSADPGRLRVAVTTRAWSGVPVDPEVAEATVKVGELLAEMGHHVDEASPVLDWDDVLHSLLTEAMAIASTLLLAPGEPDPALLETGSRLILEATRRAGALDLITGFHAQNRLTRSVAAFFTDYDLLVTPTLGQLPAPHGTYDYDAPRESFRDWLDTIFAYGPFTPPFNATGQPAISLPLGRSESRLPIGVQVVAPYGREDLLIRVAARLEEARPWPRCELIRAT
ncbi:amidase family protein [Nonomuraea sp. NEAU-A123]|uniref:amidase n=1 Tax=Nonomuraea sp. NEAU-A123 TaxID=2839649 RepID=UPI0027E12A9F|nr:amidase family protein [Nonomuraea sp. NEAU-A123]